MIAKIKLGSGFRGTLDYLLSNKAREGEVAEHGRTWGEGAHARDFAEEYEEGDRYRIIGGNMGGQTPRELAREFGSFRRLRPDIEKPVHHASLNAAKGDKLSVEQWNEIATKYIERMGFKDSPYVVIQHRDKQHDHIHIVASRIDVNERVVNEWQNKPRSEELMREVEQEYGLEQVQPSREVLRAAPTRGEIETFERTGELSAKMRLQGYVERALNDGPTVTDFVERLGRSGVQVIPNLQSTGRVSGISFRHEGELMKGSDLGRGFSWGGLQKRGLDYDEERDGETMKKLLRLALEGLALKRLTELEQPLELELKDVVTEVAKMVGKHYLNQLNPLRPYMQLGRAAFSAYKALDNYLNKPGEEIGQQNELSANTMNERDAEEEQQRSGGNERVQDAGDAFKRQEDEWSKLGERREEATDLREEAKDETEHEMEDETEYEMEREMEEMEDVSEEVELEEGLMESEELEILDFLL